MKYRPQPIEGVTTFSMFDEIKRWTPSLFVAAAGFYFVANAGQYTLIDNFDLIIHEAGHAIFRLFGETICVLGGTLMQIIVPALLIVFSASNYFQKRLQLSLVLLGQNLINISVYVGDAQTQKLHLLGPPGVIHDWHFLLNKYNMLDMDGELSTIFIICALIVFAAGIITPAFVRK